MPQTVRKYWGPFQGRTTLNFNWDAINHDSTVIVSAAEYEVTTPAESEHRFVGAATITVDNVCPHGPPFDANHGVTFVVNVDWAAPLNIVTDITVLDSAPIEIQY